MAQFFNAPASIVDDMLDLATQLAPVSFLTDGSTRIILRKERNRSHVAVVSGGGAGHEPAHASFVGPGMLTAAVSGELFASPSVDAVLTAIRQVAGPAGVLLIVKNYTGDRLNFGLAAERARSEGIQVETVLVADDVALSDAPQPRGLAGTVLVHKVAGYWADRGASLTDVHARVSAFAKSLASLGLALSSSHVPGRGHEDRKPELGLGIHNEPGVKTIEAPTADEAVWMLLEPLLTQTRGSIVLMLNDLGGCSHQELAVLMRSLLRRAPYDRVVRFIGPARVMTSLDMHGFSLTAAPASELAALEAPVEVAAWPGIYPRREPTRAALPTSGAREAARLPQNAALKASVVRVCHALIESGPELDAIDAKVGDGDAGSTFAAGARAVLAAAEADTLATADPARLCTGIGELLSHVMGGSSGVLMSIFFTAAGSASKTSPSLAEALQAGFARMQFYGGAQLGDRTMLDALGPALSALPSGVAASAKAARTGAEATASMERARAGRSSYVNAAALSGVVDPGAEAVARAFEAWVAG